MPNTKPVKSEYDDDDVIDKKELYQIDQVKKVYNLKNNFWDTIEKNLPKNKKELISFIGQYRSKFIDKIETPYPVDYPPWLPSCEKILYKDTGIEKDEFVETVLTIRGYDGYKDTYLKDKAPGILLLMIAKWFKIHNYDKEYKILCHYIGYYHYWGAFTSIFKKYKPNLKVMRYTMEELTHKSKLKSLGSVDKWLYDGVYNSIATYNDRFMRSSDFELHYINEKIHSKFKNALKIIYRAQEKNEKEKNMILTSTQFMDDDIVETSYGVTEVLGLANEYTSKFFANPISEKAIKGALIPDGIKEGDLRRVITIIASDKKNFEDLERFYQALFYLFLDNTKYTVRDIGSARFYAEMDKLYKPGNTNDKNRLYIKDLLDKWLSLGSPTFKTTNRTATLVTFRKSAYTYFILKIMEDKK